MWTVAHEDETRMMMSRFESIWSIRYIAVDVITYGSVQKLSSS